MSARRNSNMASFGDWFGAFEFVFLVSLVFAIVWEVGI